MPSGIAWPMEIRLSSPMILFPMHCPLMHHVDVGSTRQQEPQGRPRNTAPVRSAVVIHTAAAPNRSPEPPLSKITGGSSSGGGGHTGTTSAAGVSSKPPWATDEDFEAAAQARDRAAAAEKRRAAEAAKKAAASRIGVAERRLPWQDVVPPPAPNAAGGEWSAPNDDTPSIRKPFFSDGDGSPDYDVAPPVSHRQRSSLRPPPNVASRRPHEPSDYEAAAWGPPSPPSPPMKDQSRFSPPSKPLPRQGGSSSSLGGRAAAAAAATPAVPSNRPPSAPRGRPATVAGASGAARSSSCARVSSSRLR